MIIAIDELIESILEEQFLLFLLSKGPSSYHPKIILCDYTQSDFSGCKIEKLTKDDVAHTTISS